MGSPLEVLPDSEDEVSVGSIGKKISIEVYSEDSASHHVERSDESRAFESYRIDLVDCVPGGRA